ncbi:hypothetical protein JHK84_036081 [Glycine max]|nr:hypothetical protein JHK84_036081 [Glycine max]
MTGSSQAASTFWWIWAFWVWIRPGGVDVGKDNFHFGRKMNRQILQAQEHLKKQPEERAILREGTRKSLRTRLLELRKKQLALLLHVVDATCVFSMDKQMSLRYSSKIQT